MRFYFSPIPKGRAKVFLATFHGALGEEVAGHAMRWGPEIPPVPGYDSRSTYSQQEKGDVLREINLAAALYRLGDNNGKGKTILQTKRIVLSASFVNRLVTCVKSQKMGRPMRQGKRAGVRRHAERRGPARITIVVVLPAL